MHLILTGDGTHTLFVPDLNEHYHSTFGALTESMHVFIEAGLRSMNEKKELTVFEIGFGTGLNTLLTCMEAMKTGNNILYYTLEKNPVDPDIITKLNYPEIIAPAHPPADLFRAIHHASWNTTITIHERFHLHKIRDDLTRFIPGFSCDVIYFDAFAPEKQPEMWTPDIFQNLFNMLNPGGILTTYCVKGEVKRMLKKAGFIIEKLPGPPGKREMLRGRREKREGRRE